MIRTTAEWKALQAVYSVGRKLEQTGADGHFEASLLAEFHAGLAKLSDPKLSRLADHLHSEMTLRHLQNLIVPLERALDRTATDDQFLITTKDLDKPRRHSSPRDLYFALDNLRSSFNVGSIFRLGDCVGAREIFLCGYTAAPATSLQVKKTAMGADQLVAHTQVSSLPDHIQEMRGRGVQTIALETGRLAKNLFKTNLIGPCCLIVGNERFGLDRSLLAQVDQVCELPMFGAKNSLNVANALSIAAYEWSRQNS